jgi:cytoskeletal protein RodZ
VVAPDDAHPLEIGTSLRKARNEAGIGLREVEERTKIRIKYLSALEREDWEALPGPAYAAGFLRTYATELGLDAGELVRALHERLGDEPPPEERYPAGEPVLSGRERRGGRRWGMRLLALLLGLALLALAAFTVWSILDEEPAGDLNPPPGERRPERSDADRAGEKESTRPVTLDLTLRADVTVCLLGDGSKPLIDNQVLNTGSEERFEAKRFQLRFPEGFARSQLRIEVDGEPVRLEPSLEPAAFVVRGPDDVSPTDVRGGDCP